MGATTQFFRKRNTVSPRRGAERKINLHQSQITSEQCQPKLSLFGKRGWFELNQTWALLRRSMRVRSCSCRVSHRCPFPLFLLNIAVEIQIKVCGRYCAFRATACFPSKHAFGKHSQDDLNLAIRAEEPRGFFEHKPSTLDAWRLLAPLQSCGAQQFSIPTL